MISTGCYSVFSLPQGGSVQKEKLSKPPPHPLPFTPIQQMRMPNAGLQDESLTSIRDTHNPLEAPRSNLYITFMALSTTTACIIF